VLDVFAIPEAGEVALALRGERLLNWFLFTSLGLAVPLLALYSGFAATLRDAVLRVTRRPWLAAIGFYVAYVVIETLLLTPIAWNRGYEVFQRYDLLNATPWQWFAERLGRNAAQALMVAPVVALGLWLARASPRRWWLWMSLAIAPWLFAMTALHPYFVEPMFTSSTPLAEGKLKREVGRMASAAGVSVDSIVVAQESARSKYLNASVAGMGGTVRIALHDNLLRAMDNGEVRHILAHELGHYRLHHLWWDFGLGVLMGGAVLFFVSRRAPASIERNRRSWRVEALHDPAAIPLVIFWFNVALFVVSPLDNAYQRWKEEQADAYALALLKDPVACATSMRKLLNLAVPDPDPIEHAMRDTHPTLAERLGRCRGAARGA
jgi:STE24 endopeptidase